MIRGHIYVLEISDGSIKVGVAREFQGRFKNHLQSETLMGNTIDRTWHSIEHDGANLSEKQMIHFCDTHGTPARTGSHEYFQGLSFESVVDAAETFTSRAKENLDRATEAEAELLALAEMLKRRDEIVRSAFASCINKNRIHKITGLSRATIDRILKGTS